MIIKMILILYIIKNKMIEKLKIFRLQIIILKIQKLFDLI